MPSPQRRHEMLFEQLIARVLGAEVQHYDDGTVNGMVDALVNHSDGSVGALEVTTHAGPDVMEMESFGIHIDVPDSPYWWDLRFPGAVLHQKLLRELLPQVVRRLDALDLDTSSKLNGTNISPRERDWLTTTGIEIRRVGRREGGGRVAVLPEATGGAVDETLHGLTDWIASVRSESWWSSNISKLAASGYAELHFAVVLHESAVPFSLSSGFWDASAISAPPLTDIDPLTDLWLLSRYGRYIAHWQAGRGWSSHELSPE